jgi:hypothetical protein
MEKDKDNLEKRNPVNLDSKLLAYSLAAGAILAGAKNVEATRWMNDATGTIDANGEYFDISFGGAVKFQIKFSTVASLFTYIYADNFTASAGIVGSKITTGSYSASILNSSVTVSSTNNFYSTGLLGAHLPGSTANGNFPGQGYKFLGIQFKLGANTHYGWIKVSVTADASSATINTYAHEDVPDTAILTGQWDQSLAVELSALTASHQNGAVTLNWTTESEINNIGFIIDRRAISQNGDPTDWVQIASYETDDELKGQGSISYRTDYRFTDNQITPGTIYEYRLWEFDSNTGKNILQNIKITVPESGPIPEDLTLKQNYPNPFNPSTTIEFSLPEDAHVKLTIYNLKGQIIEVLKNEKMKAGPQSVEWIPSKIGSGTYFYELVAGDARDIRKLTLIR